MENSTKAIHGGYPQPDAYGSLAMPVYNTAAYEFDDCQVMADAFTGRKIMPDYSRVLNPTVMTFENRIKAITGAHDVLALNSGMAAISATLIACAEQGMNIVTSRHLFGNTLSFITKTMRRWGVEARCIDLTDAEAVRQAVDDRTACVFLEIVTNPQMEVADVRQLADIAHAHNVALIADTTAIPFTEFSARQLGIDVEVVSSTKYVSGGATSLGGLIIDYGTGRPKDFNQRIRWELVFNLGSYMTPQVAYMQTLGLETLEARYAKQHDNTRRVAEALAQLPQVKKVNWIGLPSHPAHQLAKEQYGGTFGCMFTIELADEQACYDMMHKLQLVKRATNLFDNRSLAIHPASTIFGLFTREQRQQMDVPENILRISIGLENPDDIIADFSQALG